MKKNSNTYIILYATVLVVVVAALLSIAAVKLKPAQQANIKIEKMTAILNSIGEGMEAATAPEGKAAYIDKEYKEFIVDSYCVDATGNKVEGADAFKALDNLSEAFALKEAMPIFEAKLSDGELIYVVPTYGKGLWGPIWGYVALKANCSDIYGVVLDHKSETPGLGAEIASEPFEDEFKDDKRIFDGDTFKSITLTKGVGSSKGNPYAVDAVSGGTLTSNGVSAMFSDCLGAYVPFFEKVK